MKFIKTIFCILTLMIAASTAWGQQDTSNSDDYFPGKWQVLVKGTPNGDATMIFNLTREGEELTGNVTSEGQNDETVFNRIVEGNDYIIVYWFTQGYDVQIRLNREDENNMSGSLMGMFNATAERILE